jgi:hypothetical protein
LQTYLKALPSLEPNALTFLLLRPLLYEHVCDFNYSRYFVPSLCVGLYYNVKCYSTSKTLAPFIVKLGMNSTKASFPLIKIVNISIVGHRGC